MGVHASRVKERAIAAVHASRVKERACTVLHICTFKTPIMRLS
jgi:hypothetical protein